MIAINARPPQSSWQAEGKKNEPWSFRVRLFTACTILMVCSYLYE